MMNWGIIGLGKISRQFMNDLLLVEDATIYAVGSRSIDKADAFTQEFNVAKAYDSYDALFHDPEVDIVYIGTPHNSHAELSIKALEHGKGVLCEKPIALNWQQAQQMIQTSQKQKKFFMEALWSRFNPTIVEVFKRIKEGIIGEVKYVNAEFAFNASELKNPRLTELNLGGGSLLDVGIYPLFLAYSILGLPNHTMAMANFYDTGADKQTSMILQYDHAQAILHSSFASDANNIATISGSEGHIVINSRWHEARSYSLIRNDQVEDFDFDVKGKGYTHEVEECHRCIYQDKIESDLWSHQDSLNLISLADKVREQIGLEYPLY
jgi:predicted dehydrogenase